MPASHFVRPLFEGPLDILGDIHGEHGALQDLLRELGYDSRGVHAHARRLVFIGDLCDRGEDSPAVIALVRGLVTQGLAQCLLGNHELNVLRGTPKEGNGWYFEQDHDRAEGKFPGSRRARPEERADIAAFFASLPLVLERADLRLVHAAWDDAALALLRACRGPTLPIYRAYAGRATEIARTSGLADRAAAEWRAHGFKLRNPDTRPPLLENVGRLDQHYQMTNPLRIVTSGPEALTTEPFFASGKWRMLDRVRWWERYIHPTPVMMGHYWRWTTPEARAQFSRGEHDLFAGLAPDQWLGAQRNVFCLDFGVGARYRERSAGQVANFKTRLGALRWPECELVYDDGCRTVLR